MRDYSDYDGVTNPERAAHLALSIIGVETKHSRLCCPHHGGFTLFWPARWRGDEGRARATVGCNWESWLPDDIRAELKRWTDALSWRPGTLDRREPHEIQEPHRTKIIAWARETHPALFVGATV